MHTTQNAKLGNGGAPRPAPRRDLPLEGFIVFCVHIKSYSLTLPFPPSPLLRPLTPVASVSVAPSRESIAWRKESSRAENAWLVADKHGDLWKCVSPTDGVWEQGAGGTTYGHQDAAQTDVGTQSLPYPRTLPEDAHEAVAAR